VKQNSTIQEIDLDVQLNLAHVGHRSLVPIGLILNELVVNSLKHGIGEQGRISITGHESGSRVNLTYSDNGSGFAVPVEEGFGFELIRMLTSQLDGEVTINSKPGKGVKAEFSFPPLK
jgi:two-component sensor histidine kinase